MDRRKFRNPILKSYSTNSQLISTYKQEDFKQQILNQNQLDLIDDLEKMFSHNKLADVVIVASGQKLYTHKFILSARSPVFSAMFETNMKEKKKNVVEITDFTVEVVKQMLYFMYTGKVANIVIMAKDLFIAADKYDLQGLKKICLTTFTDTISLDNVIELLISDYYKIEELKKSIDKFIVNNIKNIIKLAKFKDITRSHPQLVIDILVLSITGTGTIPLSDSNSLEQLFSFGSIFNTQ